MVAASALELLLLVTLAGSHDPKTRVVGVVLWTVYLRYSALRTALERLAEWWHDQNDPPGGAA